MIIKEMVMMMIIMMTTGLPIVKIEVINHDNERGNGHDDDYDEFDHDHMM